jgi:hypothetical protein
MASFTVIPFYKKKDEGNSYLQKVDTQVYILLRDLYVCRLVSVFMRWNPQDFYCTGKQP